MTKAASSKKPTARLLGESPAMRRVREQVRALAAADTPVLIEGESGTGKRLVARAIHEASGRRAGPFRTVSPAGLDESLLMSRLFGHRPGAFPGAESDQHGLFEITHGGTLFIEELGDLPAGVQERLLRVLETGEIMPLGDSAQSAPRPVDVRVLTGTSRSTEHDVAGGQLYGTLLERLRPARIALPPLRLRVEDIPLLAMAFLERAAAAYSKQVDGISRDAVERLTRHSWPGNVRELEAAIECAVIWATGPTLRATDLPPELG